MFGRRKKKKSNKSINETARELRGLYKSNLDVNVNINADIVTLHDSIECAEDDVKEVRIEDIEKNSPLTAFFVKVDLCNEVRDRVFDEYDQIEDVFTYKKKSKKLTYFSLDPMAPFAENKELAIGNKTYNPSKVSQLVKKSKLSYKTKSGIRCNVLVNTTVGVLSED